MSKRPMAVTGFLFVVLTISACFVPGRVAKGQTPGGIVGGGGAGVYVDAEGVLQSKVREDRAGKLEKQRRQARPSSADRDATGASPLRKVSLVRLAAALEQVTSSGGSISEEMRALAGLWRIEYLFVFPESGDVVVAGPADDWETDALGRRVGTQTGRPVLLLDDLAVALRGFESDSGAPVVGCSFEPTAAGLARVQEVVSQIGAVRRDRAFMASLMQRLRAAQGMHEIRVFGVPAESHLTLVMVEADYRLKRMGLELEPAPVSRFQSYLHFAVRGRGGSSSGEVFNRWWFMPQYEAIERSADGNAYQFRGQRLRILTEMDYLDETGQRTASGKPDRASLRYAEHFTKRYGEIAAAVPVYAALENVVDLLVVAAILQRENLPARLGTNLDGLVSPKQDFVAQLNVPRHVEASVNYGFKKRGVVISVGGGVVLNVSEALEQASTPNGSEDALGSARQSARAKGEMRWWWD